MSVSHYTSKRVRNMFIQLEKASNQCTPKNAPTEQIYSDIIQENAVICRHLMPESRCRRLAREAKIQYKGKTKTNTSNKPSEMQYRSDM